MLASRYYRWCEPAASQGPLGRQHDPCTLHPSAIDESITQVSGRAADTDDGRSANQQLTMALFPVFSLTDISFFDNSDVTQSVLGFVP